MSIHTTNYYNTFIEVAEDSFATHGQSPPERETKTIARRLYELLIDKPYENTSDELLFKIQVERKNLPATQEEKEKYFSKGQACLRSSDLPKKYGWGLHFNNEGKVALYPLESAEYKKLKDDPTLEHKKALRATKSGESSQRTALAKIIGSVDYCINSVSISWIMTLRAWIPPSAVYQTFGLAR